MPDKPILSISILTYNRMSRLKIMLEALIPQALEVADELEIVISDNNSQDQTKSLIEEFSREFPIRYIHNGVNLGGILNLILAGNRAEGEYVWVLGDDDILVPGAVRHVLSTIKSHLAYDIFVLNTRGADFKKHWPESARGGYSGEYLYLLNEKLDDAEYKIWEETLLPTNGFGTQLYISVVRTKFWKEYWSSRRPELAVKDEHNVFPHSIMIARTFKEKPCYYIGKPVLTTFDGAQSWNSIAAWIILDRVPRLLDIYGRIGVSPKRLSNIRKFVYYSWCSANLEENFKQGKIIFPTWMFMKSKLLSLKAWGALFYTFLRLLPDRYYKQLRSLYRTITFKRNL